MSDENVIGFPRPYKGPPKSLDEAIETLAFVKEEFIDEFLEFVVGTVLVSQLESVGVDIAGKPEMICQMMMIHEAIKSLMLHQYGCYHPIQSLSEAIYDPAKDDVKVKVDVNGEKAAEF
jgi:hypothetical protein